MAVMHSALDLNLFCRQLWGQRDQVIFLWITDPINILRKMELGLAPNICSAHGTSPHGNSHTFS